MQNGSLPDSDTRDPFRSEFSPSLATALVIAFLRLNDSSSSAKNVAFSFLHHDDGEALQCCLDGILTLREIQRLDVHCLSFSTELIGHFWWYADFAVIQSQNWCVYVLIYVHMNAEIFCGSFEGRCTD